jgi:glycerol-3-phosphate cytidylyltransferase
MIVGYTCGVYDILHEGHINLLKNARSMCDTLIVGLTTDDKVAYKGKYPVMTYEQRKAVLEGVEYVDAVIPQNDHDKYDAWCKLKFDVLFVGDDWYNTPTWNVYEERLKKHGVKIVYFPYTQNVSTTNLKKQSVNADNVFLVFELDHILWPFYTNQLSDSQFDDAIDAFLFSDDIVRIFKYIRERGLRYGFASRSRYPGRCARMLAKLDIKLESVPHYIQWTPKKEMNEHVTELSREFKCSPEFMILFSNNQESIDSVSDRVCTSFLLAPETCLTWEAFIDAFIRR